MSAHVAHYQQIIVIGCAVVVQKSKELSTHMFVDTVVSVTKHMLVKLAN
jgi:hypothetical protein